MCLGIPALVKEVNGNTATIIYNNIEKVVDVSLLSDVKEGDYVLIHVGVAIQKIDKEEYQILDTLFSEVKDAARND